MARDLLESSRAHLGLSKVEYEPCKCSQAVQNLMVREHWRTGDVTRLPAQVHPCAVMNLPHACL